MDSARLRFFDAPEICEAAAEVLTGFLTPGDEATTRSFAGWGESLESGTPSAVELRTEILYLRTFTVDFTVSLALGESKAKRSVLDSFYTRLMKAGTLDQSYLDRAAQYAEAVNERHHKGPAWSVGKRFASFVGAPGDLECIMKAASQFGALSLAITEMLQEMTGE